MLGLNLFQLMWWWWWARVTDSKSCSLQMKVRAGQTTVAACYDSPVMDCSSRFVHDCLDCHSTISPLRCAICSQGKWDSIARESISMPRNVNRVAGPLHLWVAMHKTIHCVSLRQCECNETMASAVLRQLSRRVHACAWGMCVAQSILYYTLGSKYTQ